MRQILHWLLSDRQYRIEKLIWFDLVCMICRFKVQLAPLQTIKLVVQHEKKINRNSNSKSESAVLNWIIKSPNTKHFLALNKVKAKSPAIVGVETRLITNPCIHFHRQCPELAMPQAISKQKLLGMRNWGLTHWTEKQTQFPCLAASPIQRVWMSLGSQSGSCSFATLALSAEQRFGDAACSQPGSQLSWI